MTWETRLIIRPYPLTGIAVSIYAQVVMVEDKGGHSYAFCMCGQTAWVTSHAACTPTSMTVW